MFSVDLTPRLLERELDTSDEVSDGKKTLKETVKALTGQYEKKIIKEALAETKGNKSEVARRLGIDYKTLLRKIKTYQIA
jgi:transcriptional regulator with PAS, ATPase and Fis domain